MTAQQFVLLCIFLLCLPHGCDKKTRPHIYLKETEKSEPFLKWVEVHQKCKVEIHTSEKFTLYPTLPSIMFMNGKFEINRPNQLF